MLSIVLNKVIVVFENVSLFNLISLIIGLCSLIFAIVFYYRSRKIRRPVYAVRNTNLIKEKAQKITNIEILYNKSKIDNLSVARVAFWNRGRETIDRSDIAPINKIRLVAQGKANLLGVGIIYEKNKSNNFSLSPIPIDRDKDLQNELEINFDYFDHNEGIILQVFHTGNSSSDIKIDGAIKNAGSIQKLSTPLYDKIPDPRNLMNGLKLKHRKLIVGFILLIVPIIASIYEFAPKTSITTSPLIKIVFLLLISTTYWATAFSIVRRRIPKGFDLFEDEINP